MLQRKVSCTHVYNSHMKTLWLLVFLAYGALSQPAPTTNPPVSRIPAQPTASPSPSLQEAVLAGAGWDTHAFPWAAYAKLMGAGIYSYSEYEAYKITAKPFQVETQAKTGICSFLRSFGPIDLFGCTDIGATVVGSNVGTNYSGGGFAEHTFSNGLIIVVGGQWNKSTVGVSVPPTVRIALGWGIRK